MPALTKEKLSVLFEEIGKAITELDSYSNEDPVVPEAGPPATEDQLRALERHWGRPLPPSYRRALSVHNGFSPLWNNVPLLSTDDIIQNRWDTTTFEEPFPRLWKSIIACGDESYDALAFDTSKVQADGEMAIVELSDEGEGERWSDFDLFLEKLLAKLKEEIGDEKADRKELDD